MLSFHLSYDISCLLFNSLKKWRFLLRYFAQLYRIFVPTLSQISFRFSLYLFSKITSFHFSSIPTTVIWTIFLFRIHERCFHSSITDADYGEPNEGFTLILDVSIVLLIMVDRKDSSADSNLLYKGADDTTIIPNFQMHKHSLVHNFRLHLFEIRTDVSWRRKFPAFPYTCHKRNEGLYIFVHWYTAAVYAWDAQTLKHVRPERPLQRPSPPSSLKQDDELEVVESNDIGAAVDIRALTKPLTRAWTSG